MKKNLALLLSSLFLSFAAAAGEPEAPPPVNPNQIYSVELKEEAVLHMGDTLNLKGTNFSAKLVGFREPVCAVPGQNCGNSETAETKADFQYSQDGVVCEANVKRRGKPASKPRGCLEAVKYQIGTRAIADRAAVHAWIEPRTSKSKK